MLKNMIAFTLIFLLTITLLQSCDATEPPVEKNINILEYDVAVTEAYIHLSFENKRKRNLQLYRDNKFIYNFVCNEKDTIIVDTALTEITTYTYKVTESNGQSITEQSNEITITTLKTTSHSFTWETFTFGEHGSSGLYDVAIIDENNIWAVGEIKLNDSNGVADQKLYNAVRWDGNNWEVERIYVDYRGKPNLSSLTGVYALPNSEIILTSGLPYLPIKDRWNLYHLWDLGILGDDDGGVIKVWGSSFQNLYFVGRKGTIVHYNGNSWQKIESGTKTIIGDVWGVNNPISNKNEVYCTVSNFFVVPDGNDKKILKISETNKVEEINWDIGRLLNTVWTNSGFPIYAGGDGLFVNTTGKWKEIIFENNYSKSHIRGIGLNNIVVVGSFGLVSHYNGKTWRTYNELLLLNGSYAALAFKKNTIAIVGRSGNKAILVIGKSD